MGLVKFAGKMTLKAGTLGVKATRRLLKEGDLKSSADRVTAGGGPSYAEYLEGVELYRKGWQKEGLEKIKKAAMGGNRMARAQLKNLKGLYLLKKDRKEAIRCFREAMKELVEAEYNLAIALIMDGKFSKGIFHLINSARRGFPKATRTFRRIASSLWKIKRGQRIIKGLAKVSANVLEPSDATSQAGEQWTTDNTLSYLCEKILSPFKSPEYTSNPDLSQLNDQFPQCPPVSEEEGLAQAPVGPGHFDRDLSPNTGGEGPSETSAEIDSSFFDLPEPTIGQVPQGVIPQYGPSGAEAPTDFDLPTCENLPPFGANPSDFCGETILENDMGFCEAFSANATEAIVNSVSEGAAGGLLEALMSLF